ncbi:MAG TPA: exonuclease SbcCD subunit D [Candidatus Acidoferrales bacterium]|nr:exonuclease SbcCD subunit D [Candidatus Acidoferrales bacterium]
MPIQIVHCSDIHLDKSFNFGDPERSSKRRKDVENNFVKIVDFALKEKPDLFLISGDVFDRVNPSNEARSFLTSQIRKLKDKNIEVVINGGNHDVPKIGSEAMAIDTLQSAGLATVFSDSINFQEKKINVDGKIVQVVGKSYNTKNQAQNPFANYNIEKDGKYVVCLIHGSLIGLNVAPVNLIDSHYNPFGSNDIDPSIDYLALGHYHNQFTRKVNTTLICNPGSIEKLNWSEENDAKGFAFVELGESSRQVDMIPLSSRNRKTIEVSLDREIPDINQHIIELIAKTGDSESLLRIMIKGLITQEQEKTRRMDLLAREVNQHYFHVDWNSTLEIEGLGNVFLGKMDNSKEAFEKHLDNLISECNNATQIQFLENAKNRGMRYLEEQIDN